MEEHSHSRKAEVDSVDKDFLLLIIRGYTSSYAIWSHIKKEVKEKGANNTGLKVMAYNNVNKRITNLAKDGLIEEVKIGKESIHGRKDYRVSIKGLEHLMPHIIAHPQDARIITKYMDGFGLDDKQAFGNLIVSKVISKIKSANEYLESVVKYLDFAPMLDIEQINQMLEPVKGYYKTLEDIYNTLFIEQTKQVTYRKTKTGHNQKFTNKLVPERRDPFFEQEEKKLERGLGHPEIADTELQEDLYRMEKSKSTRVNPIPASRKKSSTSLKKKH